MMNLFNIESNKVARIMNYAYIAAFMLGATFLFSALISVRYLLCVEVSKENVEIAVADVSWKVFASVILFLFVAVYKPLPENKGTAN